MKSYIGQVRNCSTMYLKIQDTALKDKALKDKAIKDKAIKDRALKDCS